MSPSAQVRIGRFELLEVLGEGGVGVVHRAIDTANGATVALKVLKTANLDHEETVRRLSREGRAAMLIDHPNIARVLEVSNDPEAPYVVSEFVQGRDLRAIIAGGPLSPARAYRYAAGIARGLAAAHGAGLVHSDLKPANVMVDPTDVPRLVDFGIAVRSNVAATPRDVTLTMTQPLDAAMGTVSYMAPEQVLGKPLDWRTDIFALGAIVREMITGEKLFPGDNTLAVAATVLTAVPPPLPQVPASAAKIVDRCLAKDPAARWQSAADLAVALDDAADSLRNPSKPRNGRLAAAGALALAAGAGWFLYAVTHPVAPPPKLSVVTYRDGRITGARFLPDGNILYSAEWHDEPSELFFQRPGGVIGRKFGVKGRLLAVNQHGLMLSVADSGETGVLTSAAVEGGSERRRATGVTAADFIGASQYIAISRRTQNGEHIVEFPEGKRLFTARGPVVHLRSSPSGSELAFFELDARVGTYSLVVLDNKGTARRIAEHFHRVGGLAWLDGQRILVGAARTGDHPHLWAIDQDGRTQALLPAPGEAGVFDVSRAGEVLAAFGDNRSRLYLHDVSSGAARDVTLHQEASAPLFSPDGSMLAFTERLQGQIDGSSSAGGLHLSFLQRGPGDHVDNCMYARFSEDSKSIACVRIEPEVRCLRLGLGSVVNLDTLRVPGWDPYRVNWMPGGRTLQTLSTGPDGKDAIVVLNVDGSGLRREDRKTFLEWFHQGAGFGVADGHVVRVDLPSGPEVSVCALPQGARTVGFARRPVAPSVVLAQPALPNGRGANLSLLDVATCRVSPWQTISPQVGRVEGVAVTEDLSKFVYTVRTETSNLFAITGLPR